MLVYPAIGYISGVGRDTEGKEGRGEDGAGVCDGYGGMSGVVIRCLKEVRKRGWTCVRRERLGRQGIYGRGALVGGEGLRRGT